MSVIGEHKPVRPQRDFRARRSEAMPKHSLFGTELENHSPEQRAEMRSIDLKAVREQEEKEREAYRRRRRCAKELPEYLRKQIPDEALRHTADELKEQTKQAARSNSMLKMLEERSKYYQVGVTGDGQKACKKGRQEQWISACDIEHADDINQVGLSQTGSFNRQKYGKKPPVHEYSVIGDPLNLGMDFTSAEPDQHIACFPPHRRGSQHAVPREAYMIKPKQRTDLPKLAIEVPQNIQHMFGSRICANLLSDSDKVQSTLEEQKQREEQIKHLRRHTADSVDIPHDPMLNPQYESIGNILRQDIFPGMTRNHKISVHKTDYTQDVHTRRVPCPEEYRYQRDQLSAWHEHNTLYERMKRQWDEYADNLPKLQANWDRDAKRERLAPVQQTLPKSKPKPKPKKPLPTSSAKEKQAGMEEVVFVTPPATPPIDNEPIKAKTFEKDAEFWKFYDKSS